MSAQSIKERIVVVRSIFTIPGGGLIRVKESINDESCVAESARHSCKEL